MQNRICMGLIAPLGGTSGTQKRTTPPFAVSPFGSPSAYSWPGPAVSAGVPCLMAIDSPHGTAWSHDCACSADAMRSRMPGGPQHTGGWHTRVACLYRVTYARVPWVQLACRELLAPGRLSRPRERAAQPRRRVKRVSMHCCASPHPPLALEGQKTELQREQGRTRTTCMLHPHVPSHDECARSSAQPGAFAPATHVQAVLAAHVGPSPQRGGRPCSAVHASTQHDVHVCHKTLTSLLCVQVASAS